MENKKEQARGFSLLGVVSAWVIGYTLILGGIGYWLELKTQISSGYLSIPLGFLGMALSFWQIYRYLIAGLKKQKDPTGSPH